MATDQEIRDAGFKYIPQQKYLQNPFELPSPDPVTNQGIVNTNAFANSGGGGDNNFNPAGNMFGEGTAVSPVFGNSYIDTVRREGPDSFAAYNKLSQAGGTAPAGMFQTDYFPGTQNELVDAMGRMPGQEGYAPSMDYSEDAFQKAEDKRGFLSKLMNNARQGMGKLPGWAKAAITAAGMINPFTAIPKLIGMGSGDGGPSYGIAGLSDAQKNMYDTLASQGMLYQTPGGMKTFDGKNFSRFDDDTINDYFSGKIDKYGSIEEYEDYLNDPTISKVDPRKTNAEMRKNLIKTLQFYKTAKKGSNDFQNFNNITDSSITTDLVNEFATNDGSGYTGPPTTNYNPSIQVTGPNYGPHQDSGGGQGQSGHSPGSQENSPGHPSNRANGGLMYANGGRAGYFYGGRVNFKNGGLASLL